MLRLPRKTQDASFDYSVSSAFLIRPDLLAWPAGGNEPVDSINTYPSPHIHDKESHFFDALRSCRPRAGTFGRRSFDKYETIVPQAMSIDAGLLNRLELTSRYIRQFILPARIAR